MQRLVYLIYFKITLVYFFTKRQIDLVTMLIDRERRITALVLINIKTMVVYSFHFCIVIISLFLFFRHYFSTVAHALPSNNRQEISFQLYFFIFFKHKSLKEYKLTKFWLTSSASGSQTQVYPKAHSSSFCHQSGRGYDGSTSTQQHLKENFNFNHGISTTLASSLVEPNFEWQ